MYLHFKFITAFFAILFVSATASLAQTVKPTPPEDKPVTVFTEEIKVNFSAVDTNGKFVPNLKKEDIVITENNTLHQASSIRHLPANVLIILDTGGEDRQAKSISTTRRAAKNLINSLQENDSVALIEYNDSVKVLADWTTDKAQLKDVLDKKLNFGKRSRFVDALNFAAKYFDNAPSDNRHLVLITDGLDSQSQREQRNTAFKNILTTNINVHAISYTQLEQQIVQPKTKSVKGGGSRPVSLPPGASNPGLPGQISPIPIATINLDRAMMKKYKERSEALAQSEKDLTQLTEDTNGEIYLLQETEAYETEKELNDKTSTLAGNIDSQYVLTYTPKNSINDLSRDEERIITVTSRRSDVLIQGRRKIIVTKAKL